MPYQNDVSLPERVRKLLPKHAQDIYRKAFNSAWEEYKNARDRHTDRSREATAHAVAWSAVEKEYEKSQDGKWVPKSA